jgi:RNA polymerase sigma-70 factor (ECF subfamily)
MINKLDSLKDPNLFGSWAFRIVTRKSLDFIQKEKRESAKLHDYYESSTLEETDGDKRTDIEKLLKALQILPKDQQVVVRLFYRENYSLREISNILELSIGTVKSRLFHAREKLKLILRK